MMVPTIVGGDVLATTVGAVATIVGVLVGSGLAYTVGVAQARRKTSVSAVVRADVALRRFNVTDISMEDELDEVAGIDRRMQRLRSLEDATSIATAQEALAQLRILQSSYAITAVADRLDVDLSRLAQRTIAWYGLLVASSKTAGVAEDRIDAEFDNATDIRDQALKDLGQLRDALGLTVTAGSD